MVDRRKVNHLNREESTLQQINCLAEERLQLYRKTGHGGLSERELRRIDEIDRALERLWAQYRQELAARHRARPRRVAEKKAA